MECTKGKSKGMLETSKREANKRGVKVKQATSLKRNSRQCLIGEGERPSPMERGWYQNLERAEKAKMGEASRKDLQDLNHS